MGLIRHGSYGMETPFQFLQHNYGSTDSEDSSQGFVEVLEFLTYQEGFNPILIHIVYDEHWLIHEFQSVEQALVAHHQGFWKTFIGEKPYSEHSAWKAIESFPGFIRTIKCSEQEPPWFKCEEEPEDTQISEAAVL